MNKQDENSHVGICAILRFSDKTVGAWPSRAHFKNYITLKTVDHQFLGQNTSFVIIF